MSDKKLPFYQDVDGFRIPGVFSADVYKTGLDYKPQPDDIFVSTYPKCGTTWTQMIVSLICNEGKPVADYLEFSARTPFLEMCGTEGIEKMRKPGSIKTHLPFNMVPFSPEAKYLYVVRNPKDALVSFYHHTHSNAYQYQDGNFDDYYEIFLKGETDFGDYFDNVLGWYEHRHDPNVMFLTYEELKLDTRNVIKRIAQFMGDNYGTMIENESILADVLKYSSLSYMKQVLDDPLEAKSEAAQKSNVNPENIPTGLKHVMKMVAELNTDDGKKFNLIRKGIVGDWKGTLSDEQSRRLDDKTKQRLEGTDVYKYWKSIGCI